MKINWKILFALVLVVGGIYWAVASTRSSSYAGNNLNFAVGIGPVTLTNPSITVQPVSGSESRTASIVVAFVFLGALFYISRATGHRWISILRRKNSFTQDTQPVAVIASGGQGQAIQSHGDNRANIGD